MNVMDRVVPCRDYAGRRRTLTILADVRGVILVVPAGECAVVAPQDMTAFGVLVGEALADCLAAQEEHGL